MTIKKKKTRENAIVDLSHYQIPVTQLVEMRTRNRDIETGDRDWDIDK